METLTNNPSATDTQASALPPATGSSYINIGTSERVSSAFGGAALTVLGLRNITSLAGLAMTLGGGYLLVRGLSGYCPLSNALDRKSGTRQAGAMEARSVYTINKPRTDVYAFWRKLENLPLFMQHLERVQELDDRRSSWTAKIPGAEKIPGQLGTVSWEAEITEDVSGEMIAWRSLPGSTVDNAGEVRFKDAAEGMGTELSVCISYRLPAGDLGSMAARLFNPAIERMMRDDLRQFKSLLETGDIPSGNEGRSYEPPKSKPEYTVSGVK